MDLSTFITDLIYPLIFAERKITCILINCTTNQLFSFKRFGTRRHLWARKERKLQKKAKKMAVAVKEKMQRAARRAAKRRSNGSVVFVDCLFDVYLFFCFHFPQLQKYDQELLFNFPEVCSQFI